MLVLHTHVKFCEEKFKTRWVSGLGADAKFEEVSLGWFVCFGNSWESIWWSDTKPDLKPGDRLKIVVTRA